MSLPAPDPHDLDALGNASYQSAAEGPFGDGDRVLAIRCFEAARATFKESGDRLSFAHVSYNLGNAFADMHAERLNNIERAIACYRQALEVYTFHDPDLRFHWATAHYELGLAYGNRLEGGKKENLQQAIQHYREALRVFTPDRYPKEFGCTNQNMAADLKELASLP